MDALLHLSLHLTPATSYMEENADYMFKILIIGNSAVGKTAFLIRYVDDSFVSKFVSTVGIDFKVKTLQRDKKQVKLQIWDTAGQERYRTITTAYYRGAMGFILMYDVTSESSFKAVQDWITQIKTYSWDSAQIVLVGNKCDLEDQKEVTTGRGLALAKELGVPFFETSAKENINVNEVFNTLVELVCESMDVIQQQEQQKAARRSKKEARLSLNPFREDENKSGCSICNSSK